MLARYHQALREGATLITANARLARDLRREYDLDRQRRGDRLWEAPDVLPWSAWLGRCWTECVYGGATAVLLGPAQERVIWEQVIRDSPEGCGLLHVQATAATAAEAWALANEWEVPLDPDCFAGHQDGEAFLGWVREFRTRCAERGWLPEACVSPALIQALAVSHIRPPAHLLLAGFDELTPQQQRHLRQLAERGCQIEHADGGTAVLQQPPVRMCRKDLRDELSTAAAWARARLDQFPVARIGIVILDLASIRDTVERVFDDEPGRGGERTARPARRGTALRRLAAEARFAPNNEGAPIQIMGTLEASGSNFDSLWIMGLHDRVWPRPHGPTRSSRRSSSACIICLDPHLHASCCMPARSPTACSLRRRRLCAVISI